MKPPISISQSWKIFITPKFCILLVISNYKVIFDNKFMRIVTCFLLILTINSVKAGNVFDLNKQA